MSINYQEIEKSLKKVERKRTYYPHMRKEKLTNEIYLDIKKSYDALISSLRLDPNKTINQELITAEQQLAMKNLRKRMIKLIVDDSGRRLEIDKMIRSLGILSGMEFSNIAPSYLVEGLDPLIERERPEYEMIELEWYRAEKIQQSRQQSLKKAERKRTYTHMRKEELTDEIYLDIKKSYDVLISSLRLNSNRTINVELITAEQQLAMKNLRKRMLKLELGFHGERAEIMKMFRHLGILSGIELPDEIPCPHPVKMWWELPLTERDRPRYNLLQLGAVGEQLISEPEEQLIALAG